MAVSSVNAYRVRTEVGRREPVSLRGALSRERAASRSAARADAGAEREEPVLELVRAEPRPPPGQEPPARRLEHGDELHVVEHLAVAARQEVADRLGDVGGRDG